jgi:hypothetical protein
MAWRMPELLKNEIGHLLERLREGTEGLNLRSRVNSHPGAVLGVAAVSVLLLTGALVRFFRSAPPPAFQEGRQAWFYDVNTRELFLASRKKTGPIEAPSGPTPDGELAGFRAHVYGCVLDPNESELFVGFLERPDPDSDTKAAASDIRDFDRWARSRLIRRVDDKQWVRVMSPEGQAILNEMTRPNKKGQTPIYQVPK